MVAQMIPCRCDNHPTNPNGVCGQMYLYFGHEGWGEPYGRGRRCESCDHCFSSGRRGLNILAKEKQTIGDWLNSTNPDKLLGQTVFTSRKSSYAIIKRLYPNFSDAIANKNAIQGQFIWVLFCIYHARILIRAILRVNTTFLPTICCGFTSATQL